MLPNRGALFARLGINQNVASGRRRLECASLSNSSPYTCAMQLRVSAPPASRSYSATVRRIHTQHYSTPSNSQLSLRGGAFVPLAARRFQSTSSSLIPAAAPVATAGIQPTTPAIAPESAAIDSAHALGFSELDAIIDAPVHIGYLRSLGLDYGYGPTSIVQWTLEHVYVYSGLPWWGSIVAVAVLFRLVFFKLFVGAADNAARLAHVQPISKPITLQMRAASAQGDTAKVMELRRELQLINARAGIKLWRSFAPLLQGVLGYGSFVLFRGMAALPVPGLEHGGTLWFQNLAVCDPFFILPVASAGIMHWVFRMGGEAGVNNQTALMKKVSAYVLPTFMLLITATMASGLQLTFFVGGVLSAAQAVAFRNPAVREYLGITPLPVNTNDPFEAKPKDDDKSASGPVVQPRIIVASKDSYRPAYSPPRAASSNTTASRPSSPTSATPHPSTQTAKDGVLKSVLPKSLTLNPWSPQSAWPENKRTLSNLTTRMRESLQGNLKEGQKWMEEQTGQGAAAAANAPGGKDKKQLKEAEAWERKRKEEMKRRDGERAGMARRRRGE